MVAGPTLRVAGVYREVEPAAQGQPATVTSEVDMRRMILPALALGLLAAPVSLPAQETAPRTEMRQGRPLHAGNPAARALALRDQLNLTAAQVAQLEQLSTRFEEQNRPLLEQFRAARPEGARGPLAGAGMHRGGAMATPERRAEMRERMQGLTPEQRAEMRERMQRQGPARGRMHGATPEQQERLRERMRQHLESLTPEQRQELERRREAAAAQREELRPVMEQLRTNAESARAAVRAVLTSEQASKLDELRPGRGGRHMAPAPRPGGGRGPGR